MANKQTIKRSEARILIYLENREPRLTYPKQISRKLDTDYSYLIDILQRMIEKNWLTKAKRVNSPSKTFYSLTELGTDRLNEAKLLIAGLEVEE